jgi:hypothetical protein
MEHLKQPPVWGRVFVAELIFAGIGLTGASMVTRVKAIANQPHAIYDLQQQLCDGQALADLLQKANSGIPTIEERPC